MICSGENLEELSECYGEKLQTLPDVCVTAQ